MIEIKNQIRTKNINISEKVLTEKSIDNFIHEITEFMIEEERIPLAIMSEKTLKVFIKLCKELNIELYLQGGIIFFCNNIGIVKGTNLEFGEIKLI